ncbi:MAG: trypsin-like peptidase domain-containing protein [Clostridia bacterium]|nr:trypsin-like peptidase domain-containing protein [Clostridia bacterium]
MKSRIIAFAVALILALALVGCDGSGNQGSPSGENENSGVIQNLQVTFNVLSPSPETVDGEEGEQAEPRSLKEVLMDIRPSVVKINAVTALETESVGSGVVIATANIDPESEPGGEGPITDTVYSYIVTCYHVVENATTVTVTDVNGNSYVAKPIGADADTDVCVLSVPAFLKQATFYASEQIDVGEDVVAIGNPINTLGGTVTKGIISAVNRDLVVGGVTLDLLQTDACVEGCESGCGLFTADGFFIGLVNDKYDELFLSSVKGLSFAAPSTTVREISSLLIETYTGDHLGYIPGKFYLGCTVINSWTSVWMGQSYVIISTIDSTGSFAKAGLLAGDQIISVEYKGEEYVVTTAAAFSEYIDSLDLAVGDVLTFYIRRNERAYFTVRVPILQYICGEA